MDKNEAARALEKSGDDAAARVLDRVSTQKAGEVVQEIVTDKAARIVQNMSDQRAAEVVGQVTTLKAAQIAQEVTSTKAARMMDQMSNARTVEIMAQVTDNISAARITEQMLESKAVNLMEQLGRPKASAIMQDLDTAKAAVLMQKAAPLAAARVMEGVTAEKRTDVVSRMESPALLERAVIMTPKKLHEVSAQVLIQKLTGVRSEMLSRENKPVADIVARMLASTDTAGSSVAAQVRQNAFTRFKQQIGRGGRSSTKLTDDRIRLAALGDPWRYIASPGLLGRLAGRGNQVSPSGPYAATAAVTDPITDLLVKFNKDLTDVELAWDMVPQPPAALGEGQNGYAYFNLGLKGAGPDDIEAAHLSFEVAKAWVEQNNIHHWSLALSRYDPALKAWMALPTKLNDEDNEFLYLSAAVPQFSTFAISGAKTLPPLAYRSVKLSVDPIQAKPQPPQPVTVRAEIENLSQETGVFPIALWVNKTLEEVKNVTVPAGKTTPVTFTVTRSEEGTYDVRVDKHFGKFVISSVTVFDWTTPVIIAIVVLGVLVIVVLGYFVRARRHA